MTVDHALWFIGGAFAGAAGAIVGAALALRSLHKLGRRAVGLP